MQIILAHENADFDAIAALLGAHKLYPDRIPVMPEKQNRNVAAFLALYRSGLPFVTRDDMDMKQVEHILLVDTQRVPSIKALRDDIPVHVIDHHPVKDTPDARYTLTGEVIGSTTTLLVEQMQAQAITLSSLEATLLALGVYEDTGSLTYSGTTPRDTRAAAWLLEQHADLDVVRRFLEPPLNAEQQALFEVLLAQSETRTLQGYPITVAAAKADSYVSEVAGVAHRLREILDPVALFVLVEMPSALHLVCRSTDSAINVGDVARAFGGGGHERAAAASLHDTTYDEAFARLWTEIERSIHPAVRVADLMSYGVQTLDAAKPLDAVVRQMRRIGHEGYPVVENGRVVGLLTRRDTDRAVEHGLGSMAVRDVMNAGEHTLCHTDPVSLLEKTMVETGWGQLPVVDESSRLIGIVTRTDLIRHWGSTHPTSAPPDERLTRDEVETVLGAPAARLVEAIASHAQQSDTVLYMVGGVVRDLLLKRPNLDLDFVVESDAAVLAESLKSTFGGQVSHFKPFGTAKWMPDATTAAALNVDFAALPDHVDFATARSEFYEHPTALPTVYSGSIKLDLGRRDFTINTLAVLFSPASASGHILDFYGGISDLRASRIRVLHNLSFVDDPTRILRAVRFEQRLGFSIEPRTAELIQTAVPMLRRITGERVRNEFSLMLLEREPERGLLALQSRGLLAAVHPAFAIPDNIAVLFERARAQAPGWDMPTPDREALYWHIVGACIPAADLPAVLERLLFPHGMGASVQTAARLVQDAPPLASPDARPSQIDMLLRDVPDLALLTVWLMSDDARVRERITRFVTEWRSTRITTTGHTLRERGLTPGPCYSLILTRLRAARLDGDIITDADEQSLLDSLIAQDVCRDSA